jgi:hypothetical protein
MRGNKIHVSSGTDCIAPAQFERRMMSRQAPARRHYLLDQGDLLGLEAPSLQRDRRCLRHGPLRDLHYPHSVEMFSVLFKSSGCLTTARLRLPPAVGKRHSAGAAAHWADRPLMRPRGVDTAVTAAMIATLRHTSEDSRYD